MTSLVLHIRRSLALLFFLASMLCLIASKLLDWDIAQYGMDSYIRTVYGKDEKGETP